MGDDRRAGMVWDGGWSVTALAAVLAPIVVAPLIAPDARHLDEIVGVSGVVAFIAVLFADLLIYLHWRMTGGPAGWLVVALTTLAVQSLALAAFVAADPLASETYPTRILFVQVVVAIGLFVVAGQARRRTLRVDPLLAGAAAGLAVVVVRYLLVRHVEPLNRTPEAWHVLSVLVLATDLAIAVAVYRLATGPTWLRVPLACAMGLLSVGHAAAYPTPDGALLSAVTATTNVLGATVILSVAVAMVRRSWNDNRAALELLSRQLERAQADVRVDQARLHEIRATIGGLGTASRLLHQRSAVSEPRRRQIEEMMDAEMGRLQRLLNDEASTHPVPVDLDATIQPIVIRHRTRGYPVQWVPSGQRAVARADDVAEVVNVLLENAVQHAPHAGASIVTRLSDGVVEIAISDSGPGVDRAVRSKIFDWGERGHASAGSGIGLNVARELTTDLGGYLRLVDSPNPGATFVLGLPAEDLE